MSTWANEMFLDTASVRASVVSHAKTLGYTPNSVRAPSATVNVTLNNFPSSLSTATIPRDTVFTSTVDDVSYQFRTLSDFQTTVANGILSFSNIPIHEGTMVKNRYTVDTKNVEQKFKLTNQNADTTSLKVQVFADASATAFTTYTLATDITKAGSTANVYFLQECDDGQFEIYFGDGIVGRALSDNNVVVMEYLVTNKTAANGAKNFQTTATISGVTDVTTTTVSVASGGAERESIQSIKLNALLTMQHKVVRLPQKITRQSFQRYTQTQSLYRYGVEKITQLLSLVVLTFQSFQLLVLLLLPQRNKL